MTPEEILTETPDPHGARVVLLRRVWEGKILRDHAELHDHLPDVLRTVSAGSRSGRSVVVRPHALLLAGRRPESVAVGRRNL